MYIVNIIFGIIQIILIGFILYDEVNKKSSAVFLWATLLLMFGLPHLVAAITLDKDYSVDVLIDASAFVTLFCLLYIVFRRKRPVDYVRLSDTDFTIVNTEVNCTEFEIFCVVIFVASIVLYMMDFAASQGGLMNTSWGNARTVSESYVNLSGLATRIIFAFSGIPLYLFMTKRRFPALIIAVLLILMVLLTRNRVQIIPVLAFPIALMLLKIKTVKPKHILMAGFMAVAVIYIVYGIRAFRWLGTLQHALDTFTFDYLNRQILEFLQNQDGELGLRRILYQFIDNDNQYDGFNQGATYFRMLLVFIPSKLTFGLKPESFDLTMGRAIGMAEGGSTHPTLFGDCFGNLGWYGILLGIFWAEFCNIVDYIIERQSDDFFKVMIYFLATYAYVVMGRGSVYNGFQVLAWGILILYVFRLFLSKATMKKIEIGYYI